MMELKEKKKDLDNWLQHKQWSVLKPDTMTCLKTVLHEQRDNANCFQNVGRGRGIHTTNTALLFSLIKSQNKTFSCQY